MKHASRKRPSARRRTTVNEYLLDLQIEELAEGGFLATSRQIQGLVAEGRTIAETADFARDVARKIIESCIEHGDPVPRLRRKTNGKLATTVAVSVSR